jgi:DNA-directed RNA polymerase sigma subunit (sigma70/sigma32)
MEHIGLIKKIAWSFSSSTGLEFDDLFQEAALAYCEALETFDPKNGKITTHMWMKISSHLKDYLKTTEEFKCKRQQVKTHQEALAMKQKRFSTEILDIDRPISFTNFFDSLSEDAQRIATVIIETPELFDSIPQQEVIIRVTESLLKKGIKMSRIWIGMKDLKLALL